MLLGEKCPALSDNSTQCQLFAGPGLICVPSAPWVGVATLSDCLRRAADCITGLT